MKKICTKCKELKTLLEFYSKPKYKDGLSPHCKVCSNEGSRQSRKKKKEIYVEKAKNRRENYSEEQKLLEKISKQKYVENNKEKVIQSKTKYYERVKQEAEPGHLLKKLYLENEKKKERVLNKGKREENIRRIKREWNLRNKEYRIFSLASRKAKKIKAQPAWANAEKMKRIYKDARELSKDERNFHVDHIVPLCSNVVCGLHCEFNLQPLDSYENLIKGNRYWPDMPEYTKEFLKYAEDFNKK